MMTPAIHLNGTSRDSLIEQYEKALRGVYAAIEALGEAAPNGRDYYVKNELAFELAREEHNARMEKLRSVYNELEWILEAITND